MQPQEYNIARHSLYLNPTTEYLLQVIRYPTAIVHQYRTFPVHPRTRLTQIYRTAQLAKNRKKRLATMGSCLVLPSAKRKP